MTITVTREDIDNGQRRDPEDCPVARALRRAGVSHSGVMGAAITFTDHQQHTTLLLLPGQVQEWIAMFDQGATVGPFEFELALPPTAEAPCRTRHERTVVSPTILPPPSSLGLKRHCCSKEEEEPELVEA